MARRPNPACFHKHIFAGEQPYPFIYILSMAASTTPEQSQVVATETTQPAKLKILPGPLQNKFAEPRSSNVDCNLEETAGYLKENGRAITRPRIREWRKQKQVTFGTARRRKPKANTQSQSIFSKIPWGQHASFKVAQSLAGQPVGQRVSRLKGHPFLPLSFSGFSSGASVQSLPAVFICTLCSLYHCTLDPGLRVPPRFGGAP